MPGLVKIGRTTVDLAARIRDLSSPPGIPLSFELFYACEVANSALAEDLLHEAFGDHRINKRREFFRIAPERARAALKLAEIKEVNLGDEIFASAEEKSEVEAAKRRAKFRLSMVGIKPGTELQLLKDPTIICTTVDEGNQVDFKGDITSLSDAALQAYKGMGYDWVTISGPWEWSYQGKRLDEIRREIEDTSD